VYNWILYNESCRLVLSGKSNPAVGSDGMDSFQYITHAQEVIFGAGSLARLPKAVKSLGWQRIMLCTSPSLRANGRLDSLRSILRDRLIAVFDPVQPHVQDWQLAEALLVAREHRVDAVIGMGGGSPIGMAKAVAFTIAGPDPVPVIAIPSTYAGSEMTSIFGITHTAENPPRKVTVQDPSIAPRLVIYDPELTLDLSPRMTASSGMNALAHCIEALYSITRHPLSTAAAASGVRFIYHTLPHCYARGGDIHARSDLLLGAHLAAQSLNGIQLGLHHGLCHVLGGTAGIPHGIANAIILPHAMRFNASATVSQLLPAVEAMDIPIPPQGAAAAVETAAQRISELAIQMELPQRLRDVGVKESELSQLAHLAYENRTIQNNPRPIKNAAQIENVLRAAW
jgi:maleylacetate reductase